MEISKCAICGKDFRFEIGNIYRVNFAGRSFRCCGYNCYNKALKVKEKHNSSEYQKYIQELNSQPHLA